MSDFTGLSNEAREILLRDDRGTRACVVKRTRVLLKDGLEKAIEDITPFTSTQSGDELVSIEGSTVYPVAMIAGPEEHFPIVSLTVVTKRRIYAVKVSKRLMHELPVGSTCCRLRV